MKVLYVLSPSDRMNYGDLLFSHIVQHYFNQCFKKIIFCSTAGNDLSKYGAIRTHSYKEIFKAGKDDKNYLMVAGGDCLFINWPMIISFIDKPSNYIEAISNKLNSKLYNKYIAFRYGIRTKYPFTLGKKELTTFNCVLYNSLGGSFIENYPNVIREPHNKEILNSVDYISTRDFNAHQILVQNGITSHCIPDSAILISDIFREDVLRAKASKTDFPTLGKYIFFQINIRNLGDDTNFYANLIDNVSSKFGIKVILCPIGTAPGHSDDKALKLIHKATKSGNTFLIHKPSIWNIMLLIKKSSLYIGTSLHGAITALSFNIPTIGFGAKKLLNYMQHWHPEAVVCLNKTELYTSIERQLTNPIIPNIDASKKLVLGSFNNMYKFIR